LNKGEILKIAFINALLLIFIVLFVILLRLAVLLT